MSLHATELPATDTVGMERSHRTWLEDELSPPEAGSPAPGKVTLTARLPPTRAPSAGPRAASASAAGPGPHPGAGAPALRPEQSFLESLLGGGPRTSTAPADELVDRAPALALEPAAVSFGDAIVGQPVSRAVTIVNEGASELELAEPYVTDARVTASIVGARRLPAGARTVLVLVLQPAAAGSLDAIVHVLAPDGAGVPLPVTAQIRAVDTRPPAASAPAAREPATLAQRARPTSPRAVVDDGLALVDAALVLAATVAERAYEDVHLAPPTPATSARASRGAGEVRTHLEAAAAALAATPGRPDPTRVDWALHAAGRLATEPAVAVASATALHATIDRLAAVLAQRGHVRTAEDASRPRPAGFDDVPTEAGARGEAWWGTVAATRRSLVALTSGETRALVPHVIQAAESLAYAISLVEVEPTQARSGRRAEVESLSHLVDEVDRRLRAGDLDWHGRYVVLVNREARLRALSGASERPRLRAEPHRPPASATPALARSPAAPPTVAPRPPGPPPGPTSILHQITVTTADLTLVSVVGRPTMPARVHVEVPGDPPIGPRGELGVDDILAEVEPEIVGPEAARAAFRVGHRGFLYPMLHGPTSIPVTFTPTREGVVEATLRLRLFERTGARAERVVSIPLRGRGVPAAATARDPRAPGDAPLVTPLPPDRSPRGSAEARAMLHGLADSLGSLGTVYQAQVPRMRAVAAGHAAQLGQVAGALVEQLVAWQSAEAGEQLRGLKDDGSSEFVEFLVGQGLAGADATAAAGAEPARARRIAHVARTAVARNKTRLVAAAGGPKLMLVALVTDLFFAYLDTREASDRDRRVDAAVRENELVGSFLGSAGGAHTTAAIEQIVSMTSRFARAEARLEALAGRDAQTLLRALVAAPHNPASLRAEVDRHIREFHAELRELGAALRRLAGASIAAPAAASRALAALKDEFLAFKAGGRSLGPADDRGHQAPQPVRIGGNLNLADARRPTLTITSVAFGRYRPRGAPMLAHVGAKTLRDLRGWDVTLELSLDDGSTVRAHQRADGARTVAGSARAARLAGPLWSMLDSQPLHRYWVP